MTEKEKMLAGALYRPNDPELQSDLEANRQWLSRFNASLSLPTLEIAGLLRDRLGSVGTGAFIRHHPRDAAERRSGLELGKPVFIGENRLTVA